MGAASKPRATRCRSQILADTAAEGLHAAGVSAGAHRSVLDLHLSKLRILAAHLRDRGGHRTRAVAAGDSTIGERLKLPAPRIAAHVGAMLVAGGFADVDDVPTWKERWRVVGPRRVSAPAPAGCLRCWGDRPVVRRHVLRAAAYSSSPQTPPSCSRSRSRIRAIASVGGRLENASHLMPPTSSRTARSSSPSSITQARLSLPVYTHPYPSRADRARAHPPTVAGVEEIDPLGPTPVYRQLARILRDRIASGDLAPNRPIPSEAQLRQEYGVARGTARKAVQVLRDERLVVTVTGRGTYVRPRP